MGEPADRRQNDTMPDQYPSKRQLRTDFRERRGAVSREQRQSWTPELNRHLLAASAIREARTVAGYLAFDGEPDLRFTLTQLHRRGTTVVLPVVPGGSALTLGFHQWSPATPLQPNRLGISEPAEAAAVPLEQIDVMLMPLVAYDRTGSRLGMGAGWYDRTLGNSSHRPLLAGIAWSIQETPSVPIDPWDVPLDAIVTETGWFTCPG